jgi:hypothetical protein
MDIKQVCKTRNIGKIAIQTPLLIPSFSSVVSRNIGEIHARLRDHISTASLIGAYDLYYNFIDRDKIWVSDVVFIDSGTYEQLNQTASRNLRKWSLSMYLAVLDTLKPLTKVVLINYDKHGSLKKQISDAQNLFSKYPEYATCFLCKPSQTSMSTVDVMSLIENISLIEPFNILGLTEKELGDSLLKRCENILKIRKALDSQGLTLPIHVFGCLDPLSILSYFLCGADIFDGLSWLKFGFYENVAIYINNHAFLKGIWSEPDLSIRALAYVLNLKELAHLMYNMRKFTRENDFAIFGLKENILKEVKNLTYAAGIQYG